MDPNQDQARPIGFELMNVAGGEGETQPPPVGFEGIAQPAARPPPPGLYPQLDVPASNGLTQGEVGVTLANSDSVQEGTMEEEKKPLPEDTEERYPPASDLNDVKVDTNDEMGERAPLAGDMHGIDVEEAKGYHTMEEYSSQERRGLKVAKETMFFDDGKRRIDYVLAYREDDDDDKFVKKQERRAIYEEGLVELGLELEKEDKKDSQDGKTYYIKLHCPWEVLTRYAELMSMKMPMKENDIEEEGRGCCGKRLPTCFEISEDIIKPDPDYYTTPFNRQRLDMFIIKDQENFFNNSQRSRIAHECLNTTRFDDERSAIGLRKLINSGTYDAVYPLHEPWIKPQVSDPNAENGSFKSDHSLLTAGAENDRHLLYEMWARPKNWYKFQPLDLIRKYYGEKIGIYFTWLGFYTTALIPPSLVGLICFIYGCATVFGNTPSNDICDESGIGNLTMCPMCDLRCPYWRLKESCAYSRLTYLFDNGATVFFAIFMALWATLFLEFWKRREKEIQYDWDVADFEEEEETIRPEYEATVTHKRVNPVTQNLEPYMPVYSRAPRIGGTMLAILFMICLVLAAVFAVIIYRVIIVAVLYAQGDTLIKKYAKLLTTATAALLSLITIMLLNKIYEKIAIFLTNFEQPRTETEFEDKFTSKMFLFQFVNYYSTIFYIAFFKGRLNDYPGSTTFYVAGSYRQEECDPAGCLIELCIQLGITMIGKQAFNNIKELVIPVVMNYIRARKAKKAEKDEKNVYTRWEQDFDLGAQPDLGLFEEYLEMVVQFGFITIFVAAFPLAPLFALINNVIEIRLDAYKFVTQWRRPVAARSQDIGVWMIILKSISYFSVLTNACIIAYTSDFIPKLVYLYEYSPDGKLTGYMNNSLSVFNVTNFQPGSAPEDPRTDIFGTVIYCRYRDYRVGPGEPREYKYSMQYWHIFAAKLAFVLVFEHFVFILKALIDYFVPDMPGNVKAQILREKYLTKTALHDAEALKAKLLRKRMSSSPAAAQIETNM
ncbi:anoctamin-4-like isoform X6 [Lineus longissimus]|uniref:anoctamin-4-like isoform X6 n=1 Tax=Lineus longissimus TaxID=88925 RepID=UPI00315DBCEB